MQSATIGRKPFAAPARRRSRRKKYIINGSERVTFAAFREEKRRTGIKVAELILGGTPLRGFDE